MKLLISTYYGFKEALLSAKSAFERHNIQTYEYSLFRYSMDQHDKRATYADDMIKLINDNRIDMILWWYINIPTDKLAYIISHIAHPCKQLYFNWDEPANWHDVDMVNKAKYLDYAFITCNATRQRYIDAGCKHAIYLPPAYDPAVHHVIIDDAHLEKYYCDISFCCTNLYLDETKYTQMIPRKKLLDDIYHNQQQYNYRFHIYGPEFLRQHYPLSYRGWATWHETNKIFNKSKISLCQHNFSDQDGYVNERTILISGSGGLLLIDPIAGLDKLFANNVDCVYLDVNDYIKQIHHILHNYDEYYEIRNNIHVKSSQYTYDAWVGNILKYIESAQ